MRILMFGWEYPPHAAGGLATATIALANGLAREGAELTLVVPFPIGDRSPAPAGASLLSASLALQQDALDVRHVPSPLRGYASGATVFAAAAQRKPADHGPYRHSLLRDVADYAERARAIAATSPHDIIDAHDWMSFPAAAAAQSVSGKPIVAHVHSLEFDRSGEWQDPAIRDQERAGVLNAQRVIANSQVTKKQIVERYGVRPDLVDVIRWGVEDARTTGRESSPLGEDAPIVLFVGRLVRQKGPEYFVQAAGLVAQWHPTVCFVVAGSGEMLPQLIERSIELGVADRTFFTGGLPREEIQRLYRMASVCVMPSVSEPFGLVALESLREGTPVIVSRQAGVAESIANLVHTDFWNVADIADKILAVLTDSPLRDELQTRGSEELADLTLSNERVARRTMASYARAMAQQLARAG